MTTRLHFAQIAILTPLHQLFTYKIPEGLQDKVRPGMRLVVPFRNKKMVGFCLGLTTEAPKNFDEKKIREIIEVKDDFETFSPKMIELLNWLADYYLAPIGEVCRAALPSKLLQAEGSAKATPRLQEEEHSHFHQTEEFVLTKEQQEALKTILSFDKLRTSDDFNAAHPEQSRRVESSPPILLHGITGSGKTEIYLQCIKKILQSGRQAILLVPEIGLTPQLIGRVQSRLNTEVAIYHSGLSDAWRMVYWEKMRKGEIHVVVGTRSALFAPFQNLGAIIIDEEHDSSYKQAEGGFYYHARDAAIVRGKIENIPVILGSATPSLESFYNAKKGKYCYIPLTQRATGAALPTVSIIDLRQNKFVDGSHTLSPPLKEAISERLYRGEQSLLLLNRRGFANFLLCEDCGHTPRCPNCSITLTYHKKPPLLICHYCDYKIGTAANCPECQSAAIKPLGEGTQALEEELKKNFPQAKILRLDKDTAAKREHRHHVLNEMKRGKADILIGTQIVAKGHDFPNITLVGVVLADTTLHLPDFRAHEKTFQLLTQVAGRSGRDKKAGHVLIQTFQPDNFSLTCTREHNYAKFSEQELMMRETLQYPPFSRLAQIRIQGANEQKVKETAKKLRRYFGERENISILGPAAAPLAKLRGKYRWQILLKSQNSKMLKHLLTHAQQFLDREKITQVQLQIDVDCLHLM